MTESTASYTRRGLLRVAGNGLLIASAAGVSGTAAAAPVPAPAKAAAASGKGGSGGTIGRPMPKLEAPLAEPPEGRVGYAVVGLGKFAVNQILPAFAASRRSKLVALVSGDPEKSARLARLYGVPDAGRYTYETFDQLRENPAVQVVYVIVPNALHADLVLRAAKAGKHVLCEKPLAPTSAECKRMIDGCRAAGRTLMTAYRAQYEPYNLEAIRVVRSGELGKIVSIIADHGRNIDPADPADQWRLTKAMSGGGPLPDVGIYSLNACRYLTGEEPIEVSAMLVQPKDDPKFREVEQAVHWTMRFPSGVLANCSTAYDYHDTKRFRVLGQKGWMELDPATDYHRHRMRLEHKPGGKPPGPESVVHVDAVQEERAVAEKNQFALMLDHMSECVQQNKAPKTPGEEGLRDVRIIEQIYEAGRSGRTIKL